jgi:hypothetical protein
MTVSISGTDGVTFNDNSVQTTAATGFGFKNRIINGAMVLDQRNAGASVTPVNDQYSVDRWSFPLAQSSKLSFQQNANSVTPPVGFINYLGITSLSAYSITSTDYFLLQQRVEGLNMADFGWGTANASTVTLSFWVRSSLTGTFSGSLSNASFNRSYPYSYTISSANTWEYKTITIAGDTSGTWLTTNGIGINLRVTMGSGSTRLSTGGSWQAGNYDGVTGTTSVVGTNGATFYITGVQLEKGSTATSFDYRPYGTELALCQRYYQKFSATGSGQVFCSGMMNATTTSRMFIPFLVPLRTNPTALEQSGTAGDYALFHGATLTTCSAVPQFVEATVNGGGIQATIASGGTAGNGTLLRAVTSSAYLGWSAEL